MKNFIFVLLALCLVVSCSKIQKASLDNASKNNAVEFARLDKLQTEFIVNSSPVAVQEMVINCPKESKILIEDVLRVGTVNDANIEAKISKYFTSDPVRLQLLKDVEQKYDNLGELAKELKKAFDELQEEVPSIHMPRFYTQISGFNQSIVVSDSILGISLDKYMGTDYAPYQKIFYRQQIEQMKPSRIVEDCLLFWIESKIPGIIPQKSTLLDVMMHYGKLHWIVSHISQRDHKGDSRFYFLKNSKLNQAEWESMSSRLLTRKYLYSRNDDVVKSVMFGAPDHARANELNAVGIPAGIKIVDDYMQHHPDCSIEQLLCHRSSLDLLQGAGYRLN